MQTVWRAPSSDNANHRKRALQACQYVDPSKPVVRLDANAERQHETCRSRKKKCFHLEEEPPTPRQLESDAATSRSSPEPPRVSVYNPVSVLDDLSDDPIGERGVEEPGLTHDQPWSILSEAARLTTAQRLQRQLNWYQRYKRRTAVPKLSETYVRYLDEVGARLRLPQSTTDALIPAYIFCIDDLLPILDGQKVWREYSNGEASIYLVRAICLAACKTPQALPFLKLADDEPVLNPLEFAAKLLVGLEAAIAADLEPNRIINVQILTLMHLQNDGLTGMDRASSCLSQAIHEAWAMSLHHHIPGNPEQEQDRYLWWTIRNLDKLNKPIMGATPFMVDDTDIGLERIDIRERDYRSRVMAVSMRLGDLMITATKLYKATSKATSDECTSFPVFSDVTQGVDFDDFHKLHRGYLEIWYHVAAMLSCRYSGPGTSIYTRRLKSAERILELVSNGSLENFPPLPLIPYASSLASTMIYRAFRDRQRDHATATKDLTLCCEVLQTLSQRWTSAQGLAKLARRLLKVLTSPTAGQVEKQPTYQSPATAARTEQRCTEHLPQQTSYQHNNPSLDAAATDVGAIQYGTGSHDVAYGPWLDGWTGLDAPYSQLDQAFHELFDYSMPNSFRGGEYFFGPNDDESSIASDAPLPPRLSLYNTAFDQPRNAG